MRNKTIFSLIGFATIFTQSLYGSSQSFSVAYYDETFYQEHVQNSVPRYPKVPEGSISKGYLFTYQSSISPPYGFLSLYGGVDLGYWGFGEGEQVYTYSSYVSTRLSILPSFFLHPYIEVSVGGPTFISDTEISGISFPSSFIFQNFLSLGLNLTAAKVELKMVHYGKNFKSGFTTPLIGSVGLNF